MQAHIWETLKRTYDHTYGAHMRAQISAHASLGAQTSAHPSLGAHTSAHMSGGFVAPGANLEDGE